MKIKNKILALTLGFTMAFGLAESAFACTGVIVGKDLTTDGSFIYGRTEDYERNRTMRLVVHQKGEFKKGDKLVDVNNGFEYIHPEDSLKFFSTPDSTKKPEGMEKGVYDAAGYNEKGVGIFCTVSANYSEDIEKVDPYIKDGVNEASMTTFILAHSKTARNAIEILAKTIDEKGASMGDIVAFGDKEEVWYMEIYSGHQYVAIKYPNDKFSVFPNAYWLGGVDLNDKENVIASKDIVKVAKEAKTYTETKEGLMDMAASYGPKELKDSNRSRIWSGIHHLDPNSEVKYDSEDFELLNSLSDKSEKIDIKDVLNLMRNRFEGTDYTAADSRKMLKENPSYKYPIGNINTMQAHIFQIKESYPKEAPGVMWMTLGSPLNIPFIPVFADINSSTNEFSNDSGIYDDNSYYWVASSVNDLVSSDRAHLGNSTRERVLAFEDEIIKDFSKNEEKWIKLYSEDKTKAGEFSTNLVNGYSDKAFKFEKDLSEELSKVSKVDIYGHWANEAILKNLSEGLMKGVDKLNFAPDNKITRAEFITILARKEKVETDKYKEIKMKDIEEDKYYTEYMNWAVEKGIIKGYSDNTVKVNESLTREEMAVILANYMNMSTNNNLLKEVKSEIEFNDKDKISTWATNSVKLLTDVNILNGKNNNEFAPKEKVTRAEVAQIIYNIDLLKENSIK
ncbi:MAG: C69 family dipeptidase [Peptoniphilaceae bacterium]